MNRFDMYFRQKVTEAEMDGAFDAVETALNRVFTDLGFVGVAFGMGVAQQVSPNFTVQVSGPGVAYDQTGQRIAIASTQNVDLTLDEDGLSTAVVTPGNERWLSIFVEFTRTLTDPRVDGNAATVYYNRAEAFQFNVAMGAEAGPGLAVRPSARPDQLLLADVLIVEGQTTIVNGDISTSRREFAISIPGTPHSVAAATTEEAIGQVLGWFNDHVVGAADKHYAADITYAAGPAWADAATNPLTFVQNQIDKIITDLSDAVTGGGGGGKIGLSPIAITWADASTVAGATVRAFLQNMISALGASTGSQKIGFITALAWADGTANGYGTVKAMLDGIITLLSDQVGTDDGAAKIGVGGSGFAWADGIPFSNSTVRARLLKIVTDLASTSATSGGDRVGTRAATSTNTNPQVTIGVGTVQTGLQVLSNYVHIAINEAFYDRVLGQARFERILTAAAVAGDGIVCADYAGIAKSYLAVRRVAANNDQVYSGRGLDGGMTGATTTVTSTDIKALSCADDETTTPILVGSKNPTTAGGLIAYLSTPSTNVWTIATAVAPATTSGAVIWDAVFLVSQSRWCVAGYDGATVFFQYASQAGVTWTTGTVTATISTPAAMAQGGTNMVCVGSSGWVFYSSNGTTWSRVQLGGGTPSFTGVCYNPTRQRYYAVAGSNGIWESTDATASAWTQLSLPANLSGMSFAAIACDELGRMVVSMQNTSTFISYLGATVDWFSTCRISMVEGASTTGGWEANAAGKARYRRGRFMFGDFPTSGKGAIVSTPSGQTLAT